MRTVSFASSRQHSVPFGCQRGHKGAPLVQFWASYRSTVVAHRYLVGCWRRFGFNLALTQSQGARAKRQRGSRPEPKSPDATGQKQEANGTRQKPRGQSQEANAKRPEPKSSRPLLRTMIKEGLAGKWRCQPIFPCLWPSLPKETLQPNWLNTNTIVNCV